jgi:type IV secretion system protein VirB3
VQAETIFKGATRPAMKFGIPLVPLVCLAGSSMLLCVWGGLLVSGWLALAVLMAVVPCFFWMRWVTHRDDQRFRQLFLAVRLLGLSRNRRLWRSRSYAPFNFRGAEDAWRA